MPKSFFSEMKGWRQAAALAAGLSLGAESHEVVPPEQPISVSAQSRVEIPVGEQEDIFIAYSSGEGENFRYFEFGEMSQKEKESRTEVLGPGIKVFHDIGLDFYVVQPEDTLEFIRQKLVGAGYLHLEWQLKKHQSFNTLKDVDLQEGMQIPIALETSEREISDQEFLQKVETALTTLQNHPKYGEYVTYLLKHEDKSELIAFVFAVAKQESGGKPIGQFELQRYEATHHVFSYSIFHILMEGPGLAARMNLGRTIGQLYEPQNAVEIFFAYVFEKLEEKFHTLPRDKKREEVKKKCKELFAPNAEFASFYNGLSWKKRNKDYVKNLSDYTQKAKDFLKTFSKGESVEKTGKDG